MLQIKVLSGHTAGKIWQARCFPVHIGRAASNELQLEANGVWENHLQLSLNPEGRFFFEAAPDAFVFLNGESAQYGTLRNGDILQIGSAQLQVALSPTRQAGYLVREVFAWASIALISLCQVLLAYWLLR